jgi:signal transduction histidine kinase
MIGPDGQIRKNAAMMTPIAKTSALALLLGFGLGGFAPAQNIAELEQELRNIDQQLEGLATFSMQTSVGAIGFRSKVHPDPDYTEWIHIDLNGTHEIDLIVLVPAIWRETGTGFIADGFPTEFEVLAGTPEHPEGTTIARFTSEDTLLPRIAPLAIPCSKTKASWVKLLATKLSPRAWDGAHLLQLSEFMVFAGEENLSLKQPVTASSEAPALNFGARGKAFLVDGSVPYLMNSAVGERSQAYISYASTGITPFFTVDLQTSLPVNRLHLHTIEVADTVPQANRANFGTPRHLTLEGANQADFSDANTLCSFHQQSPYDAVPIISLRFPETRCRFLRLTIDEPDQLYPFESDPPGAFFGFAEIEVFSQGSNILLDRLLTPNFTSADSDRKVQNLTDGRNIFGNILPTRTWIEQLALRHDLETSRPIVSASLNNLYAKQRTLLDRLKLIIIILTAGILILVLIGRMRRMRAITRLRQRFGADLHDEIGANLHAIGLLSDIAGEQSSSLPNNQALVETVGEVRAVTGRTADAVRYLANSQDPRKPIGSLEEDMHRIAARVMDETTCDIKVEGESHIARLRPRTRADLFLFYKECIVNISRHAEATHFSAHVLADANSLQMIIEDNGCGMEDNSPPPSLLRRAKILRATLEVLSPLPGTTRGTNITLRMRKGILSFFLP